MNRFLSAALFLILACGSLHAQPVAPVEAPKRILVFYFYSQVNFSVPGATDEPVEFSFRAGKDDRTLTLAPGNQTEPITYDGSSTLSLYLIVTKPEGIERVPVGSVTIPAEWKSVLILTLRQPVRNGGSPYLFIPLRYDAKSQEAGSLRFLNLSPYEIALRTSASQQVVAIRAEARMPLGGNADGFPFSLAIRENEEWHMLVSALRQMPESKKILMVAVPAAGAASGPPNLLTFSQFPTPPEPIPEP